MIIIYLSLYSSRVSNCKPYRLLNYEIQLYKTSLYSRRSGKFEVHKNNTNLRKELAMAYLWKRGVMWYARMQWRNKNGQKKDKQIHCVPSQK
jgi:hypothetical protein